VKPRPFDEHRQWYISCRSIAFRRWVNRVGRYQIGWTV